MSLRAPTEKQLRSLAKRLEALADQAGKFELLDDRGGFIDCQLSVLAGDIERIADRKAAFGYRTAADRKAGR